MIPLEQNIPVTPPGKSKGRVPRYPFRTAQIGESFFVPQEEATKFQLMNRLRALAGTHQRERNQKWVVRYDEEARGARVWRVG